jgi:hypothetical protein
LGRDLFVPFEGHQRHHVLLPPDCLEERKEISDHFHEKYKFPHCIEIIDGTHLGLAFNPELHREDYLTRKQTYAISVTIVCNHDK